MSPDLACEGLWLHAAAAAAVRRWLEEDPPPLAALPGSCTVTIVFPGHSRIVNNSKTDCRLPPFPQQDFVRSALASGTLPLVHL